MTRLEIVAQILSAQVHRIGTWELTQDDIDYLFDMAEKLIVTDLHRKHPYIGDYDEVPGGIPVKKKTPKPF